MSTCSSNSNCECVNYNEEYDKHLRCPNCNKETVGIEDYKNIRTGAITKTCMKCREIVYRSYNKKIRIRKKKTTMREKVELLEVIFQTNKNRDLYDEIIIANPKYKDIIEEFIINYPGI